METNQRNCNDSRILGELAKWIEVFDFEIEKARKTTFIKIH